MNGSEEADEEDMRAIQRGDSQAFARLLNRHLGVIHAYLYRMCREATVTEDLVQETFLRVWQRAGTYRTGKASVSTWLHRIAHNVAMDHFRRTKSADMPYPATDSADNGSTIEADLAAERLNRALAEMPDTQRSALVLCHLQGLSNRDAAAVLNVGVRALESLLARGRATLRTRLLEE